MPIKTISSQDLHASKVQRLSRKRVGQKCSKRGASYWDDDIVYTSGEMPEKFIRELREVTNLVNTLETEILNLWAVLQKCSIANLAELLEVDNSPLSNLVSKDRNN